VKARSLALLAVAIATALVLAACGGADDTAGGGSSGSSSSSGGSKARLSLVAYSTPQVVYDQVIPEFQKTEAGRGVTFRESFGASGDQSRAVESGLPADVVTFSLAPDMDRLVKAGLVKPDWADTPTKGLVSRSVVSFLVRKGNPKNIKDWSDLVRDDVKVVFPNPKTSGNGRYTYLAAYAYALEANKGDQEKAKEFVRKLFANVPVFDTGGRAATTTFVEHGIGDVLVTFEAEVQSIGSQYGKDKTDLVIPPVSLRADFPVAVVDKVVDERGSRKLAETYLQYLYTPEAQEIIAAHFNRPIDKEVAAKHANDFANVRLLTVKDVFGGWQKVQEEHLANGGILDQLYVNR
jgi:sulfate transport system substrate-binding protein